MTHSSATPKRRWYQFRLRTLLVVVTVAAILLALAGRSLSLSRQAAFHRSRVKDIRVMNDTGGSDSIYPPGSVGYYHIKSAEAYERTARYPWLPVALPEPLYSGQEEEEIKRRVESYERSVPKMLQDSN